MNAIRDLTLLLVLAGATEAGAQSQGAKTTVVVTRPHAPTIDLSISEVQWLPPQPLTDESGFLKAVGGLGSAAARGATLVPRLFINAVTSTEGPQQRSSGTQGIVVSPVMRVKVRNNGTERWASTGSVEVIIFPGRPEEVTRSSDFGKLIQESKTLLQLSPLPMGRGTWANNGAYLTSTGAIPGSVAPGGQEAEVQVAFLHGMTHPKDHLARYRFRLLVDKYYTARVNLTVKGDGTPGNNGVDYIFRLAPNGAIAEGRLVQRATTTNVRVESTGGVKVTH